MNNTIMKYNNKYLNNRLEYLNKYVITIINNVIYILMSKNKLN